MKRTELLEKWFLNLKNVLTISKDEFGNELLMACSDAEEISICYLLKSMSGNYEISLDKTISLENVLKSERTQDNSDEIIFNTVNTKSFINEILLAIFQVANLRECKLVIKQTDLSKIYTDLNNCCTKKLTNFDTIYKLPLSDLKDLIREEFYIKL